MRRARAVGRPRGSSKGVTRARVVAAARIEFARNGYAATTIDDIADRAGVTHAAPYQYFASKTDLWMATVHDANAALVPAYRRAVQKAGSTREAPRALL